MSLHLLWRVIVTRAVLIAVIAAAGLAVTSDARAGTYDVYACDPNHGGGAAPSFGGSADPGHTAYADCPNGDGIVARSAWDGGTSGAFQGAHEIFDAPPGTIVDSIHGYVALERPNCEWSVGVWASDGDLGGSMLYGLPPESGGCGVTAIAPVWVDLAVGHSRVRLSAACGAVSCPRTQVMEGGYGVASAKLNDARVTVRDDVVPVIGNWQGGLWSDGWIGGTQQISFDANDGAGIQSASVLLDGAPVETAANACDFTQRAPCPNEQMTRVVDVSQAKPDGDHSVTLQATDTAGNTSQVSHTVHVDNTPPAPPSGVAVDGGDGWRATNSFVVRWSNPAPDGAPITSARYKVCPVATGAECVRGSQDGDGIDHLDDVKVPRAGDWTLSVWLRDAAGNEREDAAAPPVHLRFDDAPPALAFRATDPADPTLVAADATDEQGGIARAQISIRRSTVETWTALPTTIQAGRVTARLDDETLRAGTYVLTVYAVDAAGNERTSSTRTDGQSATLTMPIRLQTALRAGKRVRHGRRTSLRQRVHLRYGHGSVLHGRLTTQDGNPLQDASVLVSSQSRKTGAAVRAVASLKTSRTGRFSFRIRPGVSRTVRVRYDGTPTIRSATRTVTVLVEARSSIAADDHHLVNGESVHFRGRLRGQTIPQTGKLVELQVKTRGHWRTFATTTSTAHGRWTYEYRFDGTRGNQKYLFRARIPREATYPFEPGHSPTTTVHVRGV
jgi:hypothetical protein